MVLKGGFFTHFVKNPHTRFLCLIGMRLLSSVLGFQRALVPAIKAGGNCLPDGKAC